MTELLYYDDININKFTAEISSIEKNDKNLIITLDKTAFYPEGGGQPADKGTIADLAVTDVQKKDGIVYHYLQIPEKGTELPTTGKKVTGVIETSHRIEYMQQHTGQHLISAAMMNTAGVETVSVRQGTDFVAIETSSEELPNELIQTIEDEANSYIRKNIKILTHWTDADGLNQFKLRRPTKHNSNVRIVEIPDIDCVACGGVHLASTADVGLIKYIYQEKIRGHVRTFWKIGNRAYHDYAEKTEIINSLNEFYSARQFELVEKTKAAADQFTETRYRFNKLQEDYAALYASIIIKEAVDQSVVIKLFENMEKNFITALVRVLASGTASKPSFIFNRTDETLTWAVACPESDSFDFNSFRANFLPIIDGKGGGKAPIWQGIAKKPSGIEELIEKMKNT